MAVDILREVPELPKEWLPDDALVMAFAKKLPDEGLWEVVLPEFTIVGQSDGLKSAVEEAAELLRDYLRMCASEGLSFEESKRPISWTWWVNLVSKAIRSSVERRIRHARGRRSRLLRFPLGHAPC
jgi:hypothetical protein